MLTKREMVQLKKILAELLDEHTFRLGKKLDRIEIKLDIMNEGITDVMIVLKQHQGRIKELEEIIKQYTDNRS